MVNVEHFSRYSDFCQLWCILPPEVVGLKRTEVGRRLRQVRDLQNRSLKSVADEAKISATYLQKLERGQVREPSPHILHRLAGALGLEYADLMQLGGYLVPRPATNPGANVLAQALNSQTLSPAEVEALAQYLAWYRHTKVEV